MWFDVLSTALLHSTWQFTLIALAFYLVRQVISDSASQIRYLAGCAALTTCLVTFLATVILTVQSTPSVTSFGNTLGSTNVFHGPDKAALIVIGWLVGTTAMIIHTSMSFMRVSQLKSTAQKELPPHIIHTFHALCRQMGVPLSVTLKQSNSIIAPCTFGVLKPIVLFPLELVTRLSSKEIEAILAHEIAHIRRHDYLVNIIQHAIMSVLYYHPAAHYISREINRDREMACDDLATKITGQPQDLASALGKLSLFASPCMTMSAVGRDNDTANRMRRLLSNARFQTGGFLKVTATALAAAGVILFTNLTLAYAENFDTELTNVQMADLRDEICNLVKSDGYYQHSEFTKDNMVRVDLDKDAIKLNGKNVTADQLPNYLKIVNKYGLEKGEGNYIYFNSRGSEIELGRDGI